MKDRHDFTLFIEENLPFWDLPAELTPVEFDGVTPLLGCKKNACRNPRSTTVATKVTDNRAISQEPEDRVSCASVNRPCL
jgi:hypothetical protein